MFSHYNKHFDVYKYQKMLRQENTYEKLFNKIQSIYLNDGMTELCEFLKISGILITNDLEFNQKLLLDISNAIVQDLDIKEKELWNTFKDKVKVLNEIEEKFYANRNEFFDKLTTNKNVTGELLIIAAEYIMGILSNPLNTEIEYSNGEDSIENRMNTYDCYIGFISNVIKYFLYNKLEFKVSSKIFKKEAVNIATKHFHLDASWDLLMDIKEYFMFSTVSIENSNDKYVIEIVDEKFDKSVIISNFREKNYMNSTHDALHFKLNDKNKTFEEKNNIISIIQAEKMLGVENMSEKIKNFSLKNWMSGYFFIKRMSENYSNSPKKNKQFKLTDMCVVKEKKWWIKQLIHYDKSITREESNIIINTFIFTSKSKDLIDNPLIDFGTKLVLVPSLTHQMCPEIALVSMLTHHGMQLNFKGYAFEKRLKKQLEEAGIVARQISSHTNISNKKINRESDVIFFINNTLFILECKSIVPPYTIKDHAKTNSKIFKELEKFKVNATYFEKNLDKVLQKLDKEPSFFIKEIVKVFVTSSTLGCAEKVDDIYVIDEAAFNSFILRKAPLIRDTSMNVYFQQNNWEFKGEITAKKLKSFLSNPPSIKGMERLLVREVHTIDNLQILRYRKKNS